ncbi:MAG TPA: class I SAM-dependent methyltransferase [Aminobacteriaceae bacterium]|nr:class I SAM-dependent methyltransferase [Aminobacteriaceae bacterium]
MSLESEKAFFDAGYEDSARASIWKFYAITRTSESKYYESILDTCQGFDVLEYGCGPGAAAFPLAERGARVTGIDISEVAIRQAGEEAADRGLDARFEVMDAENLEYPDQSFDLVCGRGIIHHLDVAKSLAEVSRVLRPEGRAVFAEPLGHNPALWIFRRLTPSYRTADEHPLVRKDLVAMKRAFREARIHYFHLVSFFAIPFLWTPFFSPVYGFLERVDQVLFKLLPPLGLLSWYCVIDVKKPRVHAATSGPSA